MRYQYRGGKVEEFYQRDDVIERAILEVLLSFDVQPGDSLDVILAQYHTERKGIRKNEFCTGLVHLMDRGLLRMLEFRFYLTDAGFDLLNRTKGVRFNNDPSLIDEQFGIAA